MSDNVHPLLSPQRLTFSSTLEGGLLERGVYLTGGAYLIQRR